MAGIYKYTDEYRDEHGDGYRDEYGDEHQYKKQNHNQNLYKNGYQNQKQNLNQYPHQNQKQYQKQNQNQYQYQNQNQYKIENEDIVYEHMLEQAISKISVYTDEWVNFLPSDPGITILENLTAFQLLLLQKIRAIPEALRPILPGLLGIKPYHGACARVLLGAADTGGLLTFDKHEKFYLGDLCFETDREVRLPQGRLSRVFLERQGSFREIQELRAGNPLSAPIFGRNPQAGDSVHLLFDGPFAEAGGEVRLFVIAQPAFRRNPTDEDYPMVFADARWSYYTGEGYSEATCRDLSSVFLESGELWIRLGAASPEMGSIMGLNGFLLKCELLHVEYDQMPCVSQIEGPLFEVYEMDSKAVSYEIPYAGCQMFLDKMRIKCSMDDDKYLFVYIGNNREGYQTYHGGGDTASDADSESFYPKSVKIIYMDKEMAVQKLLGTVYGYDNQEFELNLGGEGVPDSLEIMALKGTGEGERSFFFSPSQSGLGDIRFEYDAQKSMVRIIDAGDYEGCTISVSRYAIFHGTEGNVLPGNQFRRLNGGQGEAYFNPVHGQGGRKPEGLDEIVARMRKEQLFPGALVTAADYEQITRLVPGLCIHKVHACQGEDGRDIHIYVKPYGEGALPDLPKQYIRQIRKYLENRRLLGAKVCIAGPGYVAVDVYAVIVVKVQYADARQELEKTIRQELDYINGAQEFGSMVSRFKVLQALKRLACVESIQELTLSLSGKAHTTQGHKQAGDGGMDIRLPPDGLCYAGNLELILKRSSMI